MRRLFSYSLALVLSALSGPAVAAPPSILPFSDPNHLIIPVIMGDMIDWANQTVELSDETSKGQASLILCTLDHKPGEPQYVIANKSGGVFLVKREIMDAAWKASRYDFDVAVRTVVAQHKMCAMTELVASK